MQGHDVVIDQFDQQAVSTIFTLMSEDTMRLLARLEENWRDEIRLVNARHEQGAVAMADGYSRASGDVGVCIVGRGPAIAQTGTSLTTASKKGSDLLVVVPEPKRTATYDSKAFDQTQFLDSTIGTVRAARSPETLRPTLEDAFRHIRAGNGPVAVQVAWDVLDGEVPDTSIRDGAESSTGAGETPTGTGDSRAETVATALDAEPRLEPDPAAVDDAIDRYLDSDATKVPMVLAGQGAVQADARGAIEAFAERTNAVLATTLQGRGYFEGHPYSLGFVGDFGSNLANEHIVQSDFVLAVGCSLNPWTTDEGHLIDEETTIVQIDRDPDAFGTYTNVDLGVIGDARATVEALTAELEELGIDRDDAFWTDRLRTRIEETSTLDDGEFPEAPDRIDPRDLVRTIDRLVDDDRVVVSDGGHFSRWVLDGVPTPEPSDLLWTLDFSAIGQGVPHGIGAAVATDDRPCLTFCGDAGFMMSLQEVEAAVRHDVPVTIVVVNDSALGTEYHSLLTDNTYADVARIDAPDTAAVARSLGADGYAVSSIDELEDLEDVLAGQPDGPVVVDCQTNPDVRHRSKM